MAKPADKKLPPIKQYRLGRPFFNGERTCLRGSIQPFREGSQPKSAVEVSEEIMRAEREVQDTASLTLIKADVRAWLRRELPELIAEAMADVADEDDGALAPDTTTLSALSKSKS